MDQDIFPRSLGTRLNDLLGKLGIKGARLGIAVDALAGNSIGVLTNLQDEFVEAATGSGTNQLERVLGAAALPGYVPPPPVAALPALAPLCGAGYAAPPAVAAFPCAPELPALTAFQRLLSTNLAARTAFEAAVGGPCALAPGGTILVQRGWPAAWGRSAGRSALSRVAGGLAALAGAALFGPLALCGFLTGAAVGPSLAPDVPGPFGAFLLSGLFGIAGGLQPPLGGAGFGSWNPDARPGLVNGTCPLAEYAHQAEVDGVLRDPALTVEDKVTLMLMLIMKKMDRDIEREAQYINAIQQQQGNRGGKSGKGGKGGKGLLGSALGVLGFGGLGLLGSGLGAAGGLVGAGGQQSSPSIDVETMKLKRMVDKRSQMFDMLRQIVDKYNQTAKGVIDAIR